MLLLYSCICLVRMHFIMFFYVCVCVYDLYLMCVCAQARVQGGAQGAWPPLEIKKQKKKKVIRANFKLFHLYIATILVENIIFSPIF